jgi:hypothetical protein
VEKGRLPARGGQELRAFSSFSFQLCGSIGFLLCKATVCEDSSMRKNGARTPVVEGCDLPSLRSHKGITLREIADSTKISLRFLQAIEEGDFEQLPGGIYTTSYLRQYAREIGFEEAKLLAYYRACTAPGH